MGESIRSTVKKAARFAVYDDIIMRVKNHHIPATIRVDTALGYKSNQNALASAFKLSNFCTTKTTQASNDQTVFSHCYFGFCLN